MATPFERLSASFLLSVVGLSACVGCQQAPAPAFPRNSAGHRYLTATQSVEYAPGVQNQIVALLRHPAFTGKFLCARGIPSDSGLTITGFDAADLSTVPVCLDSIYVGGFTVLGASVDAFTPEDFKRISAILFSRRDFLFLAMADSLFEADGDTIPRTWWFVATEHLLDTQLPPPDGAERQL